MPQPDETLLNYVIKHDALAEVQQAGVGTDDFVDEFRTVWRYLLRAKQDHGAVPSRAVVRARFPDLTFPRVEQRDVPMLVAQLKQRRKHNDLMKTLTTAASTLTSFEAVDGVVQQLIGELNALALRSDHPESHLVNLFDPEVSLAMVNEIRRRRNPEEGGAVKTNLATFDRMCGGLRPQKMVVIIGRPGKGKSWLDLLFVAHAVMQGKSVILYPLEMTLFDTAMRLYTLFTQKMFGPSKVLKNNDLTSGNVNTRKVLRFLRQLEDILPGRLHVADISVLSDPYTAERIAAEVELWRPDMFWVDYLTLLKPPSQYGGDLDWGAVRQLSNGIKNTAMVSNTIGGCSAQVNRAAMTSHVFLPRLEHIAYGDSIGQDADQVFSVNRNNKGLYYRLVKNRGGYEIGKKRVTWQPNEGIFEEIPEGTMTHDGIGSVRQGSGVHSPG